jgi:autotransporter-associated beta strand protein
MKSTTCSRSLKNTALMAVFSLAAITPEASAAPLYWGQTTYSSGSIYNGTAATPGNWYTDAAGANVSSVAPDSLDDIFFNTTPANAVGGTVIVGANLNARSLTFNTSGTTTLEQNAVNRVLNLGTGGITVNAGSGTVNIGTSAHDPALTVQVTGSQSWTNNSASALTVRRLRTATGAGATSLRLNAAAAGGITVSTGITDSVEDPLSIVIDSAGAGLVIFSGVGTQNTYRGGTTIKAGALSAYGSLGSGAVQLGDTAGSSSATLNVRSATAFTNNITVRAGSSGTKTLTTNQTGGVLLNGTLTLDDNLALITSTSGTFNGAISGVGDIVKTGNGALILGGDNTFSGDLTISTGAFTLAEAGSLTFTIGANGINNQLNGASTGVVTLDGTFNFNLTGASLVGGNSWTIVNLASTAEIYGGAFSITGFTENANVWTNGSGFTFDESTGLLTYAVPEPSTGLFLLGGVVGLFAFGSRRSRRVTAGR